MPEILYIHDDPKVPIPDKFSSAVHVNYLNFEEIKDNLEESEWAVVFFKYKNELQFWYVTSTELESLKSGAVVDLSYPWEGMDFYYKERKSKKTNKRTKLVVDNLYSK